MVLWSFVLGGIIVIFVAVHAVILPRAFLRSQYGVQAPLGRGRKKIREENGKSIVYEADVQYRRYLKQYVLSERHGKKNLICKIDDKVRFIDYDIALFNDEGKVFKVLNVQEMIVREGFTQTAELPDETSFVTVCLNAANNKKIMNKTVGGISNKRLITYLILCAVIEVLGVLSVKVCLANLFGGLFGESFLYSSKSAAITCAVCAGVVALNVLFTVLSVKIRNRKAAKGERRYAEG